MGQVIGKQSVLFENPPYLIEGASIVGQKEGEGPLGKCFDVVEQDPMFGQVRIHGKMQRVFYKKK